MYIRRVSNAVSHPRGKLFQPKCMVILSIIPITDGHDNMIGLLKTDFNSLIICLYEIDQVIFYNFVLNFHTFSLNI